MKHRLNDLTNLLHRRVESAHIELTIQHVTPNVGKTSKQNPDLSSRRYP